MPRCFVMQPFDGGVFDKRYDDVLAPAICKADLEPYRVDRDPNVAVPIDDIERGIRNSEVCLAEITLDNPNVWFELGYAIACGKETVLICAATRATRFPFDVQHRNIIQYTAESTSDFEKLGSEVTVRLRAAVSKAHRLETFAHGAVIADAEGLTPHEIVALAIVTENSIDPDSPPSAYQIRDDMAKAGFTTIATGISLRCLLKKGLLRIADISGYNMSDSYKGYVLTTEGERWLLQNQSKFMLRTERPPKTPPNVDDESNDLPF